MFFNTELHLGVDGTLRPEDGSNLGLITAFKSVSGEKSNTLTFTCKWVKSEADAKHLITYLRERLNTTWVLWLGETAEPFKAELRDIKVLSDIASQKYIDEIEIVVETIF